MRVWLLTVGEPLPTDATSDREWRTGMLARQLVERGHDVVWWSSAFDHFRKVSRLPVDTPIAVSPRLTVWHLSGTEYRRNVSVARLLNHWQVARRFRTLAPEQPRPDVILCSLPTLELCVAAVEFGRARNIPVALDVRDLWPDVLFDFVPSTLRPIARRAMPWMTWQLRRATSGAAAILGVTDEFVAWGLTAAGRPATDRDRAFAMGYSAREPSADALRDAKRFWDDRGLDAASGRAPICFFGTLGWMFDFDTVLKAAERLATAAPEVVLVLCGDGENRLALERQARGLRNVLTPGRVGPPEIWDLMRRSVAGLAPYRPYRNFEDNLPNKPIEYLSAGLPIVGAESRVLKQLLEAHNCGITYAHGSVEDLVRAVVSLTSDPALRSAMSRRAAGLYAERFVAERVYDQMAAHLERLGGRPA